MLKGSHQLHVTFPDQLQDTRVARDAHILSTHLATVTCSLVLRTLQKLLAYLRAQSG